MDAADFYTEKAALAVSAAKRQTDPARADLRLDVAAELVSLANQALRCQP